MDNEITAKAIESKILTIRNQQVMIDRDLAELYGVETKALNQAVKRNIERFPDDFMFQLTKEEAGDWKSQIMNSNDDISRSQIVTLKKDEDRRGQNIKYLPYAFTEQGVAMLSSVLKSQTAVEVNIQIMRAFVAMRHFFQNNAQDIQKFNAQYPTLTLKHTAKMHDRFMIIDQKILYHIGASLKDLGKKCFAFETLDASLIGHLLKNV